MTDLPSTRPGPLSSGGGPSFPVDDWTLDQLEHALSGSFTVDDDGTHHLVGADFTMNQLLDFMSGYDPSKEVLLNDGANDPPGPLSGVPIYEYTGGAVYHQHDVIRALINEIRRLRSLTADAAGREPPC